ncbi:hypothetical protein D3C78_1471040 [compost metagenome]
MSRSRPKYWLITSTSMSRMLARIRPLRRRLSLSRSTKMPPITISAVKKAALPPREWVITRAMTMITRARRRRALAPISISSRLTQRNGRPSRSASSRPMPQARVISR